jgi:hypothetical protein
VSPSKTKNFVRTTICTEYASPDIPQTAEKLPDTSIPKSHTPPEGDGRRPSNAPILYRVSLRGTCATRSFGLNTSPTINPDNTLLKDIITRPVTRIALAGPSVPTSSPEPPGNIASECLPADIQQEEILATSAQ